MNKLSFKPQYYEQDENGVWVMKWGSGGVTIQTALAEGNKIHAEGGEIRNIPEGYVLHETGSSSRGLVDLLKSDEHSKELSHDLHKENT